MKKLEQWLGALNIQKKLIFAYLLFGVVPLIVLTFNTYRNTRAYLLDRAEKEMVYSLNQLSYGIREMVNGYYVIMNQLYINSTLLNYLNTDYRGQSYESLVYYTEEEFRYLMACIPILRAFPSTARQRQFLKVIITFTI